MDPGCLTTDSKSSKHDQSNNSNYSQGWSLSYQRQIIDNYNSTVNKTLGTKGANDLRLHVAKINAGISGGKIC